MSGPTGPDPLSDSVSQRMRNTKQKDTPAELALRSELHRRGLRFRVGRTIPGVTRGRPDIIFPTEKVAVFVDGCFWHSCQEHGTIPTHNREWWVAKLDANSERDRRHCAELESAGWVAVRIWEHIAVYDAAEEIQDLVRARRAELMA